MKGTEGCSFCLLWKISLNSIFLVKLKDIFKVNISSKTKFNSG